VNQEEAIALLTGKMSRFIAAIGKKLPDDIERKLHELADQETQPLARTISETIFRNQALAAPPDPSPHRETCVACGAASRRSVSSSARSGSRRSGR